ncbi:MAG: hypothetical protein HGA87_03270 [Desulfobulbaceae bacterium]|nr:hypothetical protein [Desulfobulbaceae bacterium]
MQTLEEQKQEILREFDFDKVHKVFVSMGYTYTDPDRYTEFIPDRRRLTDVCVRLLDSVINSDNDSGEETTIASSGRFCAYRLWGNKLKLSFEPEEWACDPYDEADEEELISLT